MPNPASPIREQLESSRKELLDLSLRNRLLNFRPLKTRGIEVDNGGPAEIFRALVLQGRTMSFMPRPEGEENAEAGEFLSQPETEGSDGGRQSNRHLQTAHSSRRLRHRLLNTFYAARSAIEELGVNLLYLALGMLEWYEDENSSLSHRAPLILIPVQLSRSDVQHRFRLSYTNEEIGTNLSLQLKLRQDFGVELPLLSGDEEKEIDPLDYYREVEKAIARLQRWKVERAQISLGFFTFTRMVMYKDLDSEAWPAEKLPEDHPLVEALLGEGFAQSEPILPETEKLDTHLQPESLHHIVETDSTQALALAAASRGQNLVIQGPPGTGKSQTITNLLGEAIAAGKRVLFVAEKRAALEVVKRKLDHHGVGDACLELHSHKATKKEFLHELHRTLRLGRPNQHDPEGHCRHLVRARDRLNRYCQAVNTPVRGSGVTPYRAFGELLGLRRRLDLDSGEVPGLICTDVLDWGKEEYEERVSRVQELQALIKRIGRPVDHAFWGSKRQTYLPEQHRPQIFRTAAESLEALKRLRQAGGDLAAELGIDPPTTIEEAELASRTGRCASRAPDLGGIDVRASAWSERIADVSEALEKGARIFHLHEEYDKVLSSEAWTEDLQETRTILFALGQTWRRVFTPRFWRARKTLTGLLAGSLPRLPEQRVAILDAILEVQRLRPGLETHETRMSPLFGHQWRSLESDWDALCVVRTYLEDVHRSIAEAKLAPGILPYLEAANPPAAAGKLANELDHRLTELKQALDEAFGIVNFSLEDRFTTAAVAEVPVDELEHFLRRWPEEVDSLQEMVSFNLLAEKLRKDGLTSLVEISAQWHEASTRLVDLLERARYGALLEAATETRPELAGFEGATHSQVVESFRELDEGLLHINRARVSLAHFQGMPRRNAGGQIQVLLHEFAKKKQHKAIRRLIIEAGHAVQAIKPVFMMSPLSVAVFLPPGSVEFDLVVFDEASQVRPVDAFGALLRSRQAIVVGDQQQLPPTSFFDHLDEAAPEDAENFEPVTRDLESILGLFESQGAGQRMLRWHYRSQHDSLIAVSNREFYGGDLLTFPSPVPRSDSMGLRFHHHPETVYERGRGKSRNRGEARIVAEAAMHHARSEPARSLGIAAFSVAQRDAIRDELELLRADDPSCEEFFERRHPEEPFFVKNLESVQGDERDVIFISIGYGRDQNGHISMNFGPINRDGGERRLNVLITRAKYRCEVFANITAEDLDLQRSRARGVHALRVFLRYARDRVMDVPFITGRSPDSVFEENVAKELTRLGYEVEPQVGSGGFFIDLAIRDPDRPGRFLLGIECDGATYHSARWARDRDRLRQLVLENLGWQIHRIWSTDWYFNSQRELERVVKAAETARLEIPPGSTGFEAKAPAGAVQSGIDRGEPRASVGAPMAAEPYVKAVLRVRLSGELHKVPASRLASWVEQVVFAEGPVHFDEVAHRIASAAGVGRVGSRIQKAIGAATQYAARAGKIRIQDRFLWPKVTRLPGVRDRSQLPNSSRKLDRIAPEELEVAILRVVEASFGIKASALHREVVRLLGFGRTTSGMAVHLTKEIARLEQDRRLRFDDPEYFVPS